jgi:UrcA family protein
MPGRKTTPTLFHLCGAASAAAFVLGGACAFAQPTAVEELTVHGHHHKGVPEDLAYRVGYSDLNLRTDAGMKELTNRIQIAAHYVCKKMNETDGACEAEAVHDAKIQARTAQHQMRAHGKHATPGGNWVPPPA